MTQEDKDLLLKDLCGRLLYGVKVRIYNHFYDDFFDEFITIENISAILERFDISDIKPYLFPLSSMTEEQYESLNKSNCAHSIEYSSKNGFKCLYFKTYSLELIDWLNENHFDYRGLIPMGSAIDATGLNIY